MAMFSLQPLRKVLRPAKALMAVAGLLALQVLGDAWVALTAWPVPGALLGMLLLLVGLAVMGRVPHAVEDASGPFLRHLMLLLIPSVAAVSQYVDLLTRHIWLFVFISTLVTGLTLAVSALILQYLLKKGGSS